MRVEIIRKKEHLEERSIKLFPEVTGIARIASFTTQEGLRMQLYAVLDEEMEQVLVVPDPLPEFTEAYTAYPLFQEGEKRLNLIPGISYRIKVADSEEQYTFLFTSDRNDGV